MQVWPVRIAVAVLVGGLACCWSADYAQAELEAIRDERCGVEVALPDPSWRLHDESDDGAVVHVYAPTASLVPRFSLVQRPLAESVGGLADRVRALEPSSGTSMRVTLGSLAGAEAQRIEYAQGAVLVVEFGVRRQADFLVVQLAAHRTWWEDPARAAMLDRILRSVRLLRAAAPAPVDRRAPEEVRAARSRSEPARPPFAIRSHDVRVEVTPADGRLVSEDILEIRSLVDGLREVPLVFTHLEVDSVTGGGKALSFRRERDGALLVVQLPRPLARGDATTLEVKAHADRFFAEAGPSPIQEVQIYGQVRADFSFSSHVFYYPSIDPDDAAVRLTITVPDGYRAISGGEAVGEERRGNRRVFRFEDGGGRPRPLPMGFTVGRYETLREKTPGGLSVEVHFLPDASGPARSVLRVGTRAASIMEELLGPLPWKRIALCQVVPARGVAGVSLPSGLVFLSECFERDIQEVKLAIESLSDPATYALISVPDEISHQWNYYQALLPNELAEGVATFSDLLFLEKERGEAAYLAGVRACVSGYLGSAEVAGDVALAAPDLLVSPAYRAVAFEKVPAVLHALRRRLGEKAFFAGFRAAIQGGVGGPRAYEEFRSAFEKASGEELGPFFDDWFYRAGYSKVVATYESLEQGGVNTRQVVLRQTQDSEPYNVGYEVEFHGPEGSRSVVQVRMKGRVTTIPWDLPTPPDAIVVNPNGTSLVRQVEVK